MLVAGWQLWQLFAGFRAPAATTAPPMAQPPVGWQLPPWQASPVGQAMGLKPPVLTVGWQLWQASLGSALEPA